MGNGNRGDESSWSVPIWSPPSDRFGGVEPDTNIGVRPPALPASTTHAPTPATTTDTTPTVAPSTPPTPANKPLPWRWPDINDDELPDGMIANRAIERLRVLKDQPFFLAVGFNKPHLPFVAPKRYWNLYDRSQFQAPTRKTLPDGAPGLAGSWWGELRQYSDIPQTGPLSDEQAVTMIHGYHAATSYADAQIGRVIDELDALGLRDNTIIILWGDHGWHLGDHGLWCKHTNYEQATRVPMIISVPGQKHIGAASDALVEFVDIYPSLCDLAGVAPPNTVEGSSFVPLIGQPDKPWKKAAFHAYPRRHREHGPVMGRAVRTHRHRLVEWASDNGNFRALELYDYQLDPEETVNIADRPENAALVKELLGYINDWRSAAP